LQHPVVETHLLAYGRCPLDLPDLTNGILGSLDRLSIWSLLERYNGFVADQQHPKCQQGQENSSRKRDNAKLAIKCCARSNPSH
jgi:hypothetical protein